MTWPAYDDLPKVDGMPRGCAWGTFDEDGEKDVYGCLNKVTPGAVKEAAKEVKEGISVSLNWPLNAVKQPGYGRKAAAHRIVSYKGSAIDIHSLDDELEFNTQCSSQWDSLCHYSHQVTNSVYNGGQPDVDQLVQVFNNSDTKQRIPTLNHWHACGGLVSRGVLLDYKEYAAAKGIKYSPFSCHKITLPTLQDIAKHQSVTFREGDILIIRTGLTQELGHASAEQQATMLGSHASVGVEGTEDVARWIWNTGFAAVAGDQLGFEVLPPAKDGVDGAGDMADLCLHPYLLSLFGCAIGELWDLQALGETCKKLKRYEFMFTSIPLNVPGAIGSPPNALAIF